MVAGSVRPARQAWSSRGEVDEQRHVVDEVARDEERAAHVLAAGGTHARDQLRRVQQVAQAEGRALHRAHDVPRDVVHDLLGQPADEATDHRLALPHRLGGTQAERLAHGLLQHDGGRALQRIDLQRGVGWQLAYDDVRIGLRGLAQLAEDLQAVRFAARGPGENETYVVMLLDQPVGVDDAQRILGRGEGADLYEQRL